MGGVAILHPQDCLHGKLFSTPVKSRRTPKPNPNLSNITTTTTTRSDGRKRSPPTGLRKNKTMTMVTDPPAVTKNLVMGQVKILKRGEALDESSTVLKEMNDRNFSNAAATTPTPAKENVGARKVSNGGRKKKSDKEKKISSSNPKIQDLKIDDFALSSTNRLGPDPEMVPKQKMAEFFFAGSAFVDSPPPSSVPLPGFFTKNFVDPSTDLRRMLGLSLS